MSSLIVRSLTIWIFFGYINYTEAGLLDNILSDNNGIGNIQRNQLLPPLLTQNNDNYNNRNSVPNTNLFQIINPNNNFNSGRNIPNTNVNEFNDPRTSRSFQNGNINNYGRPTLNNNYNRPIGNQGNLQNEKQQLEGLLERLKKMNRLKEQREKEAQNQNGGNNPDDSSKVDDVSKPEYDNKPRPGLDKSPKENGNGKWKKMTKSKVALQAKAVIPENEIKRHNETVHYLD